MPSTARSSAGMLTTTLNTGACIPLVGFGTYLGTSSKEDLAEAIYQAIRTGYRHIDTAELYDTEESVGAAIAEAIEEGIVKREDLFICTKLWNKHHAKEDVEPTLRASLARLKLDYVDLYLIHWPMTPHKGPTVQPPLQETWQAMEEVFDKGLATAIGVSNWSIKKTEELLSYARIPPAVNQVELHPGFRNEALLRYNTSNGIHTSAWSPLGGQFPNAPPLVAREEVQQVAQRTGRTPGQVILRWAIQCGVSVLPKTATLSRLAENLDLDFQFSEEDFQILSSFPEQQRSLDVTEQEWYKAYFSPEGPYKADADLWA